MSVLFGLLMNFLASVFGKVFLHASFKISITLLFSSLVIAAIYAYVSAYTAIITVLSATVPDVVTGVWGWVMPPNANICIFAIFSSVMLRFVTAQYLKLMNSRFKAAISN